MESVCERESEEIKEEELININTLKSNVSCGHQKVEAKNERKIGKERWLTGRGVGMEYLLHDQKVSRKERWRERDMFRKQYLAKSDELKEKWTKRDRQGEPVKLTID